MSSDTEVELTAQQKWTKMTKDDPPWHYRRAKKLDKAAYCKPGVDIKRPLAAFEEGVDYFSDREDAIHAWEASQAASHKKRKRQHLLNPEDPEAADDADQDANQEGGDAEGGADEDADDATKVAHSTLSDIARRTTSRAADSK